MRISQTLQTKLEDIFKALEYTVRYEKGNFKSGYCILQETKVVVINKFFSLEGKVNALSEILREIDTDDSLLDPAQQKLLQQIRQTELKF